MNTINMLDQIIDQTKNYPEGELLTIRAKLAEALVAVDNIIMNDDDYYEYVRTKNGNKLSPQQIVNSVSAKLEKVGGKLVYVKNPFEGKTNCLYAIQDINGNVRENITYKNLNSIIHNSKKNKLEFKRNFISYDECINNAGVEDLVVAKRTEDLCNKLNEIVKTKSDDYEDNKELNVGLFKKFVDYIFSPFK